MTTTNLTDLLHLHEQYDDDDIEIIELGEEDLDSPERIRKQLSEGVKRGQLWMARDSKGKSCYVLIASLCDDPRTAAIVPLSNDLHAETADSLVIEQGSPLNMPMVAWPDFKAIIPINLLYKPMKEFAPATVDALESGDPLKASPADVVRQGNDPQDEDGFAFDIRDAIVLTVALWHAKCADLPELGQLDRQNGQADDAFEAYSRALQEVLGLAPSVRLAVMRGSQPLSDAQQRKMERAGFPSVPRKSEAIPDDYLIMAEQPEFYRAAELINPANPEQARQELARKAAYGLAARVTGHGESALRGAFLKAAEQLQEQGKEL